MSDVRNPRSVEEVIRHDIEHDPRFEAGEPATQWSEHLRELTHHSGGCWVERDVDPSLIDNPTFDDPSQEKLRRVFEYLKLETVPPRVLLHFENGRYMPVNGSHRCAVARIKNHPVPAYVLTAESEPTIRDSLTDALNRWVARAIDAEARCEVLEGQVEVIDHLRLKVEERSADLETAKEQRDLLAFWVTQARTNAAAPSSFVELANRIVSQSDYVAPTWSQETGDDGMKERNSVEGDS